MSALRPTPDMSAGSSELLWNFCGTSVALPFLTQSQQDVKTQFEAFQSDPPFAIGGFQPDQASSNPGHFNKETSPIKE